MEERRKSKRLELQSKIIIKSLNDPGTQHEAVIDIIDVSKTGVGFSCNLPLEIGTVYEAFLTIWTKEVLHAFIEIVFFQIIIEIRVTDHDTVRVFYFCLSVGDHGCHGKTHRNTVV